MITLRVDEPAAIPLSVESDPLVAMAVTEAFIGGGGANIQNNKNATPSTSQVVVTPDQGFDGMAKVTVEAMPQGALSPIDIDFDDSTGAFTAEARVGTSGYISDSAFVGGGFQLATQEAATITPSNVQRQAVAAHKYTTGAVVVDPIPPEYIIPPGTKNIVSNGNNQDVKAYEKVNVNVPNSYAAADEGKVVSNGALVAQTSDTVTQNGVVDTTLINSLDVNVSGGGSLPSRISSITTCTLAADYYLGEVASNAILSAAGFSTKQSNHAYLIQLIDKNPSDYGTDQFVGGVYYSSGHGALVRWRNSNYAGAIGSNSSAVYAYTGDNYMVIDMIMVES